MRRCRQPREVSAQVEKIVQEVSAAQKMPVEAISSFVGGSAPRFWYSLSPDAPHANYAQIVLLFKDKHQTRELLPFIQARASREIASARIDVRQLENGDSVGLPVAIRISGEDAGTAAGHRRARQESVSGQSAGYPRPGQLGRGSLQCRAEDRHGSRQPGRTDQSRMWPAPPSPPSAGARSPRCAKATSRSRLSRRLRTDELAGLNDVNNLYVYSGNSKQKVPLRQVAHLDYNFRSEVIRRRNQFRTITVSAVPQDGILASEVMDLSRTALSSISDSLPPGYKIEIGGEEEKQKDGFGDLTVVLVISVIAIFLALTFQFKNAVKPFIVFAAVPFGAIGAMVGLYAMGAPFGFMGFLGVISLVGVIVSHIIVLFDFIEEKHAEGEPFEQAVLDAGIMRLRPVMITVGATVFGLFPLAVHGGPLWEPLCYAQIGGLTAATFITLLLVPVFYAICVLDLKIVKWDTARASHQTAASEDQPLESYHADEIHA